MTTVNGRPEVSATTPPKEPSAPQENKSQRRADFFETVGYHLDDFLKDQGYGTYVDRIPYMWDFGFLLCRKSAWENAVEADLLIPNYRDQEARCSVENVWKALAKVQHPSDLGENGEASKPVGWRTFLQACVVVASAQATRDNKRVQAFDLDMLAAETLSCLVLESSLRKSRSPYRTRKATWQPRSLVPA
ncbi:MAG TPA: hypothetical protein VFB38_00175 [Chthonomonadaceae bacterium]|nr:hypothetical protein [Chthonomonadaceae bacterium]